MVRNKNNYAAQTEGFKKAKRVRNTNDTRNTQETPNTSDRKQAPPVDSYQDSEERTAYRNYRRSLKTLSVNNSINNLPRLKQAFSKKSNLNMR